jgi:hypothetical protein
MNRAKRSTLQFVSQFEEMLLNILGAYLVMGTAVVCAVCGLSLAEWLWPRVTWIETTLIIIGVVIGGGAGLLTMLAIHERLSEASRSTLLWLVLSIIPGAAVLLALVECAIRAARWWARDGASTDAAPK